MKISLLDYSAIRAANAAQANANSFKISVLGQQHNNLMTKADVIYTDKNAKMNERMQSVRESSVRIQNQIRQIQRATERKNSAISSAVKLIDFGINLTSSIIDYKTQKDTEAANSLLSDISTDYSIQLANDVANNSSSYIDSNGNVVKSPTLVKIEDSYRKMIEDADLGKNVKDKALSALNDMFNSAWGDIAADLISANITARDSEWNTRLGEAVKEDSKTGTPALTNELIDNTGWLLPNEKEALKAQWEPQITANYQANRTTALASEQGLSSALDYVNSLDIGDTEKEILRGTARDVAGEADSDTASRISSALNEEIQKGTSPYVINQQLETLLGQMEPDRRAKVEEVINPLRTAYANSIAGIPSSVKAATLPELVEVQTTLNEQGQTIYAGIPDSLEAAKKMIDSEISARYKDQEDLNEENLATAKAAIDNALQMYTSGEYSGDAISRFINAYTVVPGDKDNTYALDALSKMAETIPDPWKDTADTFLKDFKTSYTSYLKKRGDETPAPEVSLAVSDAEGRIIDLFRYMSGNEVTKDMVESRMQSIMDAYMGPMIEELAGLEEDIGDQSLSIDARFGINNSFIADGEALFDAVPDIVFTDSDNNIHFSLGFAKDFYDETAHLIIDDINTAGIFGTPLSVQPRVNSEGKETAIPVVTTTTGEQFTIHEGNLAKIGQDGEMQDVSTLRFLDDASDLPKTEEQRQNYITLGNYARESLTPRDYASEIEQKRKEILGR